MRSAPFSRRCRAVSCLVLLVGAFGWTLLRISSVDAHLLSSLLTFLETHNTLSSFHKLPGSHLPVVSLPRVPQLHSSLKYPVPDISNVFPNPQPHAELWIELNRHTANELIPCLKRREDCRSNRQETIIILGSSHFRSMLAGRNGGEEIWARSIMLGLKSQGYTFFFARDLAHVLEIHALFPQKVRAILLDEAEMTQCTKGPHGSWTGHSFAPQVTKDTCVKSFSNPNGIPIWKLFAFLYWNHDGSPLGGNWTLNPDVYDPPKNTFIGYSVEPSCRPSPHWDLSMRNSDEWHADSAIPSPPYIPAVLRPRFPPRASILGKWLRYFYPQTDTAFWGDIFDAATEATNVTYRIGAQYGAEAERDMALRLGALPKSVVGGAAGEGRAPQEEFVTRLAESRVLIGLGMPLVSPTPYEALCLGVPFINPILNWDMSNPSDRSKWFTQHDPLKVLGPPYVYHVFAHDRQGFVQAVLDAIANPIEPLVLERMKISTIGERIRSAVVERDSRTLMESMGLERDVNGDVLVAGEVYSI